MNKSIIKFILVLIVALMTVTGSAQSSDDALRDKITNAVMKVYDDQLKADPNDYNTLFARAHQHYYNGDYTAALTDVNQALSLTPATEKELLFDEYILRARISDVRKDYTSELADLRMAQELQPKSLPCTDLIAKANLKAGNLDAAEKAFKTILRAESINYDAMYGLAQVEQARGNSTAAIEQVNKAVELFRTEPQVYVNRAGIYASQGNIDAAVVDLLQGMNVGDGGVAAQRLFELSDNNYDGVMQSLSNLADKATDSGMFRFLRANIALDHLHYGQALSDLNFIKRNNLYNSPVVSFLTAKCNLELARYDEALTHVTQAIQADPTQPEFYLVKALAAFNAGEGNHYDAAFEALHSCSLIAPQYVPMLLAKADLYAKQGDDNEALGYLNAALANEPGNAEALLSRALLFKRINNMNLAVKDLNTMTHLSDDVLDLKGLALSELGRDTDAFKWLNGVTAVNQPGGENFYYAALFMALKGDSFKAMEYVQKAIDNGYGSLYKLKYDELSSLNLKSLRGESGFDLLIDKAQRNFTERH